MVTNLPVCHEDRWVQSFPTILRGQTRKKVNEIVIFSLPGGVAAAPRRLSPAIMTISLPNPFLMLLILLFASSVYGGGPAILFDNQHRPVLGIPPEARAQERTNSLGSGSHGSLSPLLRDSVKALRVQYFNKESWKTEDQVRAYLGALTTNQFTEVYGLQMWSESVGTPEIDCLVDFTEEYQSKVVSQEHSTYRQGRLLLWLTEACFRDGSGRWWFVNVFDHFHRHHPLGKRSLARPEDRK
jgi:hypothetical protein